MAKKTLSLVLVAALTAAVCVPARAAVSSTKSYTLSVTVPEKIELPAENIKPLDLDEAIAGFSVREFKIRFIEITEIVMRGEPVVVKSVVAL